MLLSLPAPSNSSSLIVVVGIARPLRDSGDALCDALARGASLKPKEQVCMRMHVQVMCVQCRRK
jgi:hypothetical protein